MEKAGVSLQFRSSARRRAWCLPRKGQAVLVACAAALALAIPAAAPRAEVLQPHDMQPGTAAAHESNLPATHHAAPTTADGLPAVLTAQDAERYRRIFALQEDGRWPEADRLIAELGDRRLLGHVL